MTNYSFLHFLRSELCKTLKFLTTFNPSKKNYMSKCFLKSQFQWFFWGQFLFLFQHFVLFCFFCFSSAKSTNLANFLDSKTNNQIWYQDSESSPDLVFSLSVCIPYPSQVWKPVHHYWEGGSRLPWSMFLFTWGHSTHQHSIQATVISQVLSIHMHVFPNVFHVVSSFSHQGSPMVIY